MRRPDVKSRGRRAGPRLFFIGANMNQTLRHLLVAAAIGVTSFGAYAQNAATPSAGTATPSNRTDVSANVRAEADYRAAIAACDAQTGSAKAACLSDAEKQR